MTLAGKTYTTQIFFDPSGNPTTLILPDNHYVAYTRNTERRTTSMNALVANAYSAIFSNAVYRPDALLTSLTYGNGVGLSYSYDTSGHRLYSNNTTALNASFLVESYSWDLEGHYKSRFSSGAGGGYAANTSFLYDGFGRLKQETGTPTPQSFTYDDNSNRLSNGARSYTYLLNTNRLYSRDTALPTLDAAGNTLNNGLKNGLGQTYTWDSFGRLVSVTTATGTTQYQYNYLNQRVSKTLSNGSKTLYHYDHEGRLFLETSSTGVMQAWYVYHDSGNIAAIIYGANSPYNATAQEQVLYIHSDHLGTPRIAFDSLKRVVWRWESDAFGTTAPLQDPDKDGKATLINLRFPGQYYDAETQLHYNWSWYYDPQLGRYISSDPIGLDGGLNTFGYVGQSPLGFKDPKGLFWENAAPEAYAEVGQFMDWVFNHSIDDCVGLSNLLRAPDFVNFQIDFYVGSV